MVEWKSVVIIYVLRRSPVNSIFTYTTVVFVESIYLVLNSLQYDLLLKLIVRVMFLLFLVFMDDSHTVFFYLLNTTALKTISLPAHIMCHGNNYQEQKVHVAQMIKMKHY